MTMLERNILISGFTVLATIFETNPDWDGPNEGLDRFPIRIKSGVKAG